MMKNRIIIIIYLFIGLILFQSCQWDHSRHSWTASIPDNYDETRIRNLYEQAPEQALSLIDSIVTAGLLADFQADMLRASLFTGSVYNQRHEQALHICENLLRHDSVKVSAAYQKEVLELLVNASRMRHDDEQWINYATRLCNLLREQGNEADALRTEAEIGLVLTHLGQLSAGQKKIDNAIALLAGNHSFRALNALILAMKRKIVVLRETDHHADILPVAQRIQECLDDFKEHPQTYLDDSRSDPMAEEERLDFCDFYGAQATAFKAAALAKIGNMNDARQELANFEQTNYGRSLDGRLMIAPTLLALGEYGPMLAIYDEAEAKFGGDTLRYDYAEILNARASAAEAQGRLTLSLDYHKRYEALTAQLNERLQRSEAHQYAARFHAQEQQMEIDRHEAEAKRNGIIARALGIGLLLVAGFIVYYLWQRRLVGLKNRVLVTHISDAIEYKQRYESLKKAIPSKKTSETAPQETASDMTSEDTSSMTDEQLFRYLSESILNEQLFLNPMCDRQMIVDRFGISEKRVGAAFSKGSVYKSVASFIRDSRLEYACQLLRLHSDMSIGRVASASGFSNHTRFTADFKTKYSMSPTEFRALSL